MKQIAFNFFLPAFCSNVVLKAQKPSLSILTFSGFHLYSSLFLWFSAYLGG